MNIPTAKRNLEIRRDAKSAIEYLKILRRTKKIIPGSKTPMNISEVLSYIGNIDLFLDYGQFLLEFLRKYTDNWNQDVSSTTIQNTLGVIDQVFDFYFKFDQIEEFAACFERIESYLLEVRDALSSQHRIVPEEHLNFYFYKEQLIAGCALDILEVLQSILMVYSEIEVPYPEIYIPKLICDELEKETDSIFFIMYPFGDEPKGWNRSVEADKLFMIFLGRQ